MAELRSVISLTRDVFELLENINWEIYRPSIERKEYKNLDNNIAVYNLINIKNPSRFAITHDKQNGRIFETSPQFHKTEYYIRLDPTIDWQRDIIKFQMLEKI